MTRRLVFIAILIVGAFVAVGCADDSSPATGPAPADLANEPPYGPGAEVGRSYDYVLYVHCGVHWARIDGTWWETTLQDDGNANPPVGWGNPYDVGTVTSTGEDEARYEGGPDATVVFARTDRTDSPIRNCE